MSTYYWLIVLVIFSGCIFGYIKFKRRKTQFKIKVPIRELCMSQLDYIENLLNNMDTPIKGHIFEGVEWYDTKPIKGSVPENPEWPNNLPELGAPNDVILKVAKELSDMRDKMDSMERPHYGRYCPICHIATRSKEATTCPLCGLETYWFDFS